MSFFDRFLAGASDKIKQVGDNLTNGQKNDKSFKGQGQSLGGSLPGKVIPITLSQTGPLGVQVERRVKQSEGRIRGQAIAGGGNGDGTAIVAMVVPGSQAEQAGLQRGDIICFPGSQGQEEVLFEQFLEWAKSNQRPLHFEVRRVVVKTTKTPGVNNNNATGSASSSSSSSTSGNATNSSSADAFARKQAVIAAAEARERAASKWAKPSGPKKNVESGMDTRQQLLPGTIEPMSEEAKQARERAKVQEIVLAAQLGYNPYEANKATAGQARNATVAVTHGAMQAPVPSTSTGPSASLSSRASAERGGGRGVSVLPSVRPPSNAIIPEGNHDKRKSTTPEPPLHFQEALQTVLSLSDQERAKQSLNIVRKLIVNATTKGQLTENEETALKFRKVRCNNPKIAAAVLEVDGCLEIMLAVGFVLQEDTELAGASNNSLTTETMTTESVLVYPPHQPGPDWLPTALEQMQLLEQ